MTIASSTTYLACYIRSLSRKAIETPIQQKASIAKKNSYIRSLSRKAIETEVIPEESLRLTFRYIRSLSRKAIETCAVVASFPYSSMACYIRSLSRKAIETRRRAHALPTRHGFVTFVL